MSSNKKLLILGGSGLVGSSFDALNFAVLRQYLKRELPHILINFIAFTNIEEAEKEKGNIHINKD